MQICITEHQQRAKYSVPKNVSHLILGYFQTSSANTSCLKTNENPDMIDTWQLTTTLTVCSASQANKRCPEPQDILRKQPAACRNHPALCSAPSPVLPVLPRSFRSSCLCRCPFPSLPILLTLLPLKPPVPLPSLLAAVPDVSLTRSHQFGSVIRVMVQGEQWAPELLANRVPGSFSW